MISCVMHKEENTDFVDLKLLWKIPLFLSLSTEKSKPIINSDKEQTPQSCLFLPVPQEITLKQATA